MSTIYDYDLHDMGRTAFRSILRDAGYNPMASSLTRQQWAYQEQLIDEMGEGLGQADGSSTTPSSDGSAPASTPALPSASDLIDRLAAAGIDRSLITTCGTGFLAAAFAGYVSGKIGVLPTAAGVGIAYFLLKSMQQPQAQPQQ